MKEIEVCKVTFLLKDFEGNTSENWKNVDFDSKEVLDTFADAMKIWALYCRGANSEITMFHGRNHNRAPMFMSLTNLDNIDRMQKLSLEKGQK